MTANKKRFFIIGILIGAIILALSIIFKTSPVVKAKTDKAKLVQIVLLQKQLVAPQIKAFGRIEPKHIWKGIAEVNGKITYRHPKLETGRILPAGTLVLRIDPLEYELKLAQAEANLNTSKTQLKRLIQQQKNIQLSLQIERQKLSLIDQEYKRKQTLQQKGLLSASDVDIQKHALLVQRNLVQELTGTLDLIPDDKRVIQSEISVNEDHIKDAYRQLQNTRFNLPFDARIATVNIETEQAVSNGSVLFEAHQIGKVEVKAEFSLQDAQLLMQSISEEPVEQSFLSIEQLELSAQISLTLGNTQHHWPAQVTRISETITVEQGTIGFYLEAEQFFSQAGLIKKPPLTQGMFVSASITGFQSKQFVVPERALHGDLLYIMDKNQRLQLRQVEILFRIDSGVAVSGNLQEGDQLVLNDLIPAVANMTLKTHSSVGQEPRL
ncbi:efflux RND transporter periplasmic adaptor subunit [Psychromonas sp. KJ10-10]|uniref:efflux RND transporter periplasmic adaptor subunit n=1 Tax=Psychromonas sp. KJ10-10 TaxID=3391823 RepID=UPI0039B4ECC3